MARRRAQYTAQQFIDAIPNTGGVISTIAARVGCDWHTAKKFIDGYPTVASVYDAEKRKVDDKARSNVLQAINDGDVDVSKWWLRVKLPDEFAPSEKREVSGPDGGPAYVVRWDETNDNS